MTEVKSMPHDLMEYRLIPGADRAHLVCMRDRVVIALWVAMHPSHAD